jgi:hypothetical protein
MAHPHTETQPHPPLPEIECIAALTALIRPLANAVGELPHVARATHLAYAAASVTDDPASGLSR